jgi:N-carbamoyl-D-amino-acid hydrolase
MSSRTLIIGAAQLGPIARDESRESAVARMVALARKAAARGCNYVVFPELSLTTFFPRWFFNEQGDIDNYFEHQMPNAATQALFDVARELQIWLSFGYAELVREDAVARHYNSSIIVDANGTIVAKYRKVHLPGHYEHEPQRPFQHLEKRYFEPGDLGFPVWELLGGKLGMCICNDRRWPETFRVMGLQGVELVTLGYNTPVHYPPVPAHDHLQNFHNHLVLQASAYQNGTWIVAVAKAGNEEGCDLIGGSCIVAPTGEIVAQCSTLDDELIVAECDLSRCDELKHNVFNFDLHRQPQHYGLITAPK